MQSKHAFKMKEVVLPIIKDHEYYSYPLNDTSSQPPYLLKLAPTLTLIHYVIIFTIIQPMHLC